MNKKLYSRKCKNCGVYCHRDWCQKCYWKAVRSGVIDRKMKKVEPKKIEHPILKQESKPIKIKPSGWVKVIGKPVIRRSKYGFYNCSRCGDIKEHTKEYGEWRCDTCNSASNKSLRVWFDLKTGKEVKNNG